MTLSKRLWIHGTIRVTRGLIGSSLLSYRIRTMQLLLGDVGFSHINKIISSYDA